MNLIYFRKCMLAALLLFLSALLYAQTENQTPSQAPTPAPAQASSETTAAPPPAQPTQEPAPAPSAAAPKGFVLLDGTPVRLRTGRTVSSADAHAGDTVDFEILEDVSVDGLLVIPKGGLALATVTEAMPKRRMARGGKLNINIDSVRLATGDKAALRAVKEVKGGGHTGAMTGGIVATGIVFFPAAPFFLFMHGKDITIPKGTEITAYVSGDMKLDRAKFQAALAASTVPDSKAASPAVPLAQTNSGAQYEVSSTPSGADIELDGNFIGNTPSSVGISAGQHKLALKKSGFKTWEKQLTVTSGNGKINATLEAESK